VSSYDDGVTLLDVDRPAVMTVDIFSRSKAGDLLDLVLRSCPNLKTLGLLVTRSLPSELQARQHVSIGSHVTALSLWALHPTQLIDWGDPNETWRVFAELFPLVETIEVDYAGAEYIPRTLEEIAKTGAQLVESLMPALHQSLLHFRRLGAICFARMLVYHRVEGIGFISRSNIVTCLDRRPDISDGWA